MSPRSVLVHLNQGAIVAENDTRPDRVRVFAAGILQSGTAGGHATHGLERHPQGVE
jgi:hypothetical protein